MWQIREVLETLARDALVIPKTVDDDANKVRALLVEIWLSGLATWTEESSDHWLFRITDDGRAALDSALMTEGSRVTESAQAFRGDHPQ
jgi:hypothetical protein